VLDCTVEQGRRGKEERKRRSRSREGNGREEGRRDRRGKK
jgi:hypothetical protein